MGRLPYYNNFYAQLMSQVSWLPESGAPDAPITSNEENDLAFQLNLLDLKEAMKAREPEILRRQYEMAGPDQPFESQPGTTGYNPRPVPLRRTNMGQRYFDPLGFLDLGNV